MSNPTETTMSKKWPAVYPDRLQLYSFPTPNGVKVSAMLEETGISYEPHLVRIAANEQFSAEFLALNPNNKIPAILDPNGPGGRPLALFESGAILLYLAEKSGQFLPKDTAGRYETIQWLMFQMGGIGPMFGQFGFFHKFAGKEFADKRPHDRYLSEVTRLLGVLEGRLAKREWIMGNVYTIADMAVFPWVNAMSTFYEADELIGMTDFPNVQRVTGAFLARPAIARALNIPKRDA